MQQSSEILARGINRIRNANPVTLSEANKKEQERIQAEKNKREEEKRSKEALEHVFEEHRRRGEEVKKEREKEEEEIKKRGDKAWADRNEAIRRMNEERDKQWTEENKKRADETRKREEEFSRLIEEHKKKEEEEYKKWSEEDTKQRLETEAKNKSDPKWCTTILSEDELPDMDVSKAREEYERCKSNRYSTHEERTNWRWTVHKAYDKESRERSAVLEAKRAAEIEAARKEKENDPEFKAMQEAAVIDDFLANLSYRLIVRSQRQAASREDNENRHLQKTQHETVLQKIKRSIRSSIRKTNQIKKQLFIERGGPRAPDSPDLEQENSASSTPTPPPDYEEITRYDEEAKKRFTIEVNTQTKRSGEQRVEESGRRCEPSEFLTLEPVNSINPTRNNPPTFTQKLKYAAGFCVGLGLDVLDSLYRGFSFLQSCEDLVDNPRLMDPEFGNTQRAQILSVSNAIGNRLLSLWNHPIDDMINLVRATSRGLINIGSNSLHQLQRSEKQFQAGHHFVAGLQVGCAIYEPLALSFVGSGLVRGSSALLKNTKTLLYSLGDSSIVSRGVTGITESFNLNFRINTKRSLWNAGGMTTEFSEVTLVTRNLTAVTAQEMSFNSVNLSNRLGSLGQQLSLPIIATENAYTANSFLNQFSLFTETPIVNSSAVINRFGVSNLVYPLNRFSVLIEKTNKQAAREFLCSNEARQILTENQIQTARQILRNGRADEITFKVLIKNGFGRLILERAGHTNGFQRLSYEIAPNGEKIKVVQTGIRNDGSLQLQKPGTSKNNLYDVKKWISKLTFKTNI